MAKNVELHSHVWAKDLSTRKLINYTFENSPEAGTVVSPASPVGMALLHAKEGDILTIKIPRGKLMLEIIEVTP